MQLSRLAKLLIACTCTAISGCGSGGPVVVHGTVTCAGEPVPTGDVTFVPLDGTEGPGGGAEIVDGAYRIDGRGGLLPGKYRVMVNALQETGRTITQSNGFEQALVQETRQVGPPAYASANSPLVIDLIDSSSNPVNIELPSD